MSINCLYNVSKTKVLNLRIDPALKKKAKRLADADSRSLSNWVTRLIEKAVAESQQKSGE